MRRYENQWEQDYMEFRDQIISETAKMQSRLTSSQKKMAMQGSVGSFYRQLNILTKRTTKEEAKKVKDWFRITSDRRGKKSTYIPTYKEAKKMGILSDMFMLLDTKSHEATMTVQGQRDAFNLVSERFDLGDGLGKLTPEEAEAFIKSKGFNWENFYEDTNDTAEYEEVNGQWKVRKDKQISQELKDFVKKQRLLAESQGKAIEFMAKR